MKPWFKMILFSVILTQLSLAIKAQEKQACHVISYRTLKDTLIDGQGHTKVTLTLFNTTDVKLFATVMDLYTWKVAIRDKKIGNSASEMNHHNKPWNVYPNFISSNYFALLPGDTTQIAYTILSPVEDAKSKDKACYVEGRLSYEIYKVNKSCYLPVSMVPYYVASAVETKESDGIQLVPVDE